MFGLGINNPFNLKERSREEIDGTKTEEQSAYQKFFAKELAKRNVKSPAELSPADKKAFYNYIDANWKGEKESD